MRFFYYFSASIFCVFSFSSIAQSPNDSLVHFETLTKKIGLRTPKLREGDYQIRLWVNFGLRFGEAQELYIVSQKHKRLKLKKIVIEHTKEGYSSHKITLRKSMNDTSLVQSLIKNKLLHPHNQGFIIDSLIKTSKLQSDQRDYNTYVKVKNDTLQVITQRHTHKVLLIYDGSSYLFDVFGNNYFQKYAFGCPNIYAHFYKESVELQNAFNLVLVIFEAFKKSSKDICYVPFKSHDTFTCL